jgi:co-chaperonin GroES (HSP10)
MKIKPLHDRVVVRRIEDEQRTPGGVIIPDTVKEKPMHGEVLAVRPGARDESGKRIEPDVRGRHGSIRQVVGHRGRNRRRGAVDHEGVRHHGHHRGQDRRQQGGVSSGTIVDKVKEA